MSVELRLNLTWESADFIWENHSYKNTYFNDCHPICEIDGYLLGSGPENPKALDSSEGKISAVFFSMPAVLQFTRK